ncbi:MAG: Gfo/Idh/MocA family protein [Acidobacteriota bacterium]|jgi:predicted dehydrogenase
MKRLRWGVLSTSRFAQQKIVPAMQDCQYAEVTAIASRDRDKASEVASRLGIAKVHDSYESLLADPEIEVVYNPLPNHLHVPLSIAALEAGKHVLCEKPLGLDAADATRLLEAAQRHPHLKVMEAFMYRFHPQWQTAQQLVAAGRIGRPLTIHSFFSYFNTDPANVRNREGIGGGGLLDIGCYCISLARFIFGDEPRRVVGLIENDPDFRVDRRASAILDFGERTATFTCSTQLVPYQRVQILGDRGRIEIEVPFNQMPDRPARLFVDSAGELEEVILPPSNQYTIQGDLFSLAVINDTPVPTPLEDAISNMRVIDAVFASARRGSWVDLD